MLTAPSLIKVRNKKLLILTISGMGKLSTAYGDKRILLSNKKRTNNNMRESHRRKNSRKPDTERDEFIYMKFKSRQNVPILTEIQTVFNLGTVLSRKAERAGGR